MKILCTILISTIFFVGIIASSNAQSVGESAPDFTLNTLSKESFSLSEQNGKVVFIFLFGWNCPHCKANGPNTESDIYSIYKNNPNFVAVGVETWDGNTFSTQSYVSVTGLTYPILLYGSSLLSSYSTTYDRIVVIDKDGIIKYKSSDVANKTITAEASAVISGLLEETSAVERTTNANKKFQIAPNPVLNQLFFKTPDGQSGQALFEVYDLKGQLVLSQNIELVEQNSINASELPNGFYMVRLLSNNKIWTDRLIIVE